jgi:hypothetical protein
MRRTVEIERALVIFERREKGETLRAIGEDFGLSPSQTLSWWHGARRHREGLEMLVQDPTDMEGLIRTSQLELAPSTQAALSRYGVESLAELSRQEWSRTELLMVPGIGPASVGQLALAMRAFGFSLLPDREVPKKHDFTPQAQHWAEERERCRQSVVRSQQWSDCERQLKAMDDSREARSLLSLMREIGYLEERVRQLRGEIYDETDGGECEPELVIEPHPAGPNVVYFPRRQPLPAEPRA